MHFRPDSLLRVHSLWPIGTHPLQIVGQASLADSTNVNTIARMDEDNKQEVPLPNPDNGSAETASAESNSAKRQRTKLGLLSKLNRPKTWSGHVALIVLVWFSGAIVLRGLESVFGWLDLVVENKFKTPELSVEFIKPITLSRSNLRIFSETNGLPLFDLRLDEPNLTNYVIFPFKFKNPRKTALNRLCLDLFLPAALPLDLRYVISTPKEKSLSILHSLSRLKMRWPTNSYQFRMRTETPIEWNADVYVSFWNDRGFGKISEIHRNGDGKIFSIEPNHNFRWLYFRLISRNEAGEGDVFDNYSIPAPGFMRSLSLDNGTNGSKANDVGVESAYDPATGKTEICFESGLDPLAELTLYFLCKPFPQTVCKPTIQLVGSPEIRFRHVNAPSAYIYTVNSELDPVKGPLTPQYVKAISASNQIVIYWDKTSATNYRVVRIYRSEERPIGRFSNLGEKVFDGYGHTNKVEIAHRIEMKAFDSEEFGTALGFDGGSLRQDYFNSPPFEVPLREPNDKKPLPPSNLRGWFDCNETLDNLVYFVDSTAKFGTNYTYTLYFLNSEGQSSYPIVVREGISSKSLSRTVSLSQ
jgi:hypothetical protein